MVGHKIYYIHVPCNLKIHYIYTSCNLYTFVCACVCVCVRVCVFRG